MNNQWVTPGGDPIDSDWAPPSNPMPPSNDWNDASGCNASSGPAIVDGITITGVPAQIVAPYAWGITLNDGAAPPNFSIDHYDANGALIEHPIAIDGTSGDVMLTHDPTQELGAATKQYVDTHGGIQEPPDNQTYGRTDGAWNLVVPQSGGTFGGPVGLGAGGAVTSGALLFVGSAVCQLPAIAQLVIGGGSFGQVPATDGDGNLSWMTPVTGGPYVPISGNVTMTGPLIMSGSNMIALNSPLSAGQSAILGQKSGLNRWQMQIGDYTAEGLNNVGSNFSLTAYSTTGGMLGTWLSIARADGSTVFNGAGVTVQGNLAVNGILAIATPGQFALYGGTPGQFLQTNGSGVLAWATPAGSGGGIPDAPSDGHLYGRENAAWAVVPPSLPDAPSTGQTYGRNNAAWTPTVSFPEAPPDGQYYARRQLAWQPIPPGGATISDTAPASPSVGQLWWDLIGAQLYTYYNDGNSSQWVPATNAVVGPPGPSGPNVMPPGVTDGSIAAPGQVGEFRSTNNTTLALTSGVVTSLATLNLGAGEWDVWGAIAIVPSAANASMIQGAISLTAATIPNSIPNNGSVAVVNGPANLGSCIIAIPQVRFNFTATTLVWLVCAATFASGTATATTNAYMQARRAR